MSEPIFILAGEPSGDRLAASMMGAVNGACGRQRWIGVGGHAMESQGLESSFRMEDLTVMGFGEAVSNYRRLSRIADRLVERAGQERPRLILTVDAKGFSFRLAARLRRSMRHCGWRAPIVHTVAPTVWAWGEWRKHKLVGLLDGLLCLFPFEPEYFTPLGLNAQFIGHPEAFDPIYLEATNRSALKHGKSGTLTGNGDALRENAGGETRAAEGAGHLVILPGSRRSEISRLLEPMLDAFAIIREQRSGMTASIPTLPERLDQARQNVTRYPGMGDSLEVTSSPGSLFDSFAKGDAILAASGTVTLQAALYGMPGVTCYAASRLSAFIGRRIVRNDRIILPNILLERDVYPFFFQEEARPQSLAEAVLAKLEDEDAKRRAVSDAAALRRLLRGGADSFEANIVDALAPWMP